MKEPYSFNLRAVTEWPIGDDVRWRYLRPTIDDSFVCFIFRIDFFFVLLSH